MMLTYIDERWETRLFPPGVLFHLSHLGPEFQVLCFLTSVPNRVWDSMGSPLSYLPSFVHSSGGPSWFYFCNVCVLVGAPAIFETTRASGDIVFLLVQTWKLGG